MSSLNLFNIFFINLATTDKLKQSESIMFTNKDWHNDQVLVNTNEIIIYFKQNEIKKKCTIEFECAEREQQNRLKLLQKSRSSFRFIYLFSLARL